MPYSKRWELVHILGGKCVKCGNENFYDLEIDHIHNDGDGERKYYTNLDKRYVDNPIRTKQRLQLLCKKCHKDKHYTEFDWNSIPNSPKPENKFPKIQLFMDVLKSLEGENKQPVPQEKIEDELKKIGFEQNEPHEYIRRMLREASIYESKPGCYNRV